MALPEGGTERALPRLDWRPMRADDLEAVVEIARLSFPDHFEDRACFQNRLALYPRGCFVLAAAEGAVRGYLIAYPWRADAAPPLNTVIEGLPAEAEVIYLHDLALHPEARGGGVTPEIVERLAEQADERGWPARALGADISLDARTDDLADAIKAAGSADVVLDMVGRDYAELNLNALKPGGRWVVIASLSGPRVEIDLQRIMLKRLVLTGSTLRSRSADQKARLVAALEAAAWPWIASGAVRPPVEATFPLEKATLAHLRLEAGDHIGKIVLTT